MVCQRGRSRTDRMHGPHATLHVFCFLDVLLQGIAFFNPNQALPVGASFSKAMSPNIRVFVSFWGNVQQSQMLRVVSAAHTALVGARAHGVNLRVLKSNAGTSAF